MITCYLRYEMDPNKLAEFEAYGRMWLELLPRFGGVHHGYFLPSEGVSDVALAMFSFSTLAAYERYRNESAGDPDVQKAIAFAKETRCFRRYERSFFRPLQLFQALRTVVLSTAASERIGGHIVLNRTA